MNLKKIGFLIAALSASVTSAFAGYTITRIDGGPNTLVQGREYAYEVVSNPPLFDNVTLVASGPLANYTIIVGNGIQVGPNEFKVNASGRLNFVIRYHAAPGNIPLTVTNTNDSTVFTTITNTIQRYPTTFSINPTIPTFIAGVPAAITVTALDSVGSVVTAFQDAVQITDRQLNDVTSIPGSAFVNGSASANVTVRAGDMNNKTALRVDLTGIQYMTPSPVPLATFTTPDLNLTPGAYNKVVMLFPGENLDPGFGKTGTVTTQVANTPVSLVTIWPVDVFFNPIRSNVNNNISFTSSNSTDTMPLDRLMVVPPLQVSGAASDPFKFLTNGTRTIKATPDGDDTKSDTASVPVAPGANNTYEFTVQPGPLYTTDSVINVQITAKAGGLVLDTLYGTLPNAVLSARVIGSPTQENQSWVDTNPATLIPDNAVTFNAGVANVNLVVTKRGNIVDLHFQDQFGVGVFSNQFQVEVGALDKIHLTIVGRPGVLVGETFTPGTYPGNSGTPPAITAGQDVVVEARLTDRHWNIVSGPAVNGMPVQLDSIIPNTYITSTHPDDPTVTFDISGELKYQAAPFDRSFRATIRTAGTNRQFRANSTFAVTDFLSSTVTVNPAAYSKLVLQVPGETLRPGSFFSNGKEGAPTSQGAGLSFAATVFVTDPFWNPVSAGPYPNVRFGITPSNAQSFISGVTLGAPTTMPGNSRVFTVTLAENSDVTVTDNGTPSINQTDTIPVGAGNLDHFKLTFTVPGNKEAGVPYQVTIRAEDQFNQLINNYNQTIDLAATTGAGTMSPATVVMANGLFTGDLTNFAAGTGVQIRMSKGSVISFSTPFNVNVNSSGFQRVLLLGPDEVQRPGTATGKSGTNSSRTVGTGITMTAVACDQYYNKLTISGNIVDFASDQFAIFSPANGAFATGEFSTTLVMHEAASHMITATVQSLGLTSTSTITGLAGAYSKVQLVLPGQTLDPGNVATKGINALSTTTAQKVSIPFAVTLRAVDQFYNLVSNYNGGDTILTVNTVNNRLIPPNNAPGGITPRAFVNGVLSRNVLIGEQGLWTIDAKDQSDFTKTGMVSQIQIQPGPVYTFSTPASATAGSQFSVTIRLEEGGVPLAGYNESIFLDAYLPAGGPATGAFNPNGTPREYVMTNGEAIITDLSYAHVENIQIRLTDNFNRVAFSNTINMVPSGLKYRVTVPAQGIAGPPQTFPVTVQLLDLTTETLIKNPAFDHTIGINIISLLSTTTAGTGSLSDAPLTQGVAALSMSYSKAEQIKLEIRDLNNAVGAVTSFSNSMLIRPDGYKRLLILAPGEIHEPGLFQHPTGKSGTPQALDKSVQHVFQVRGVDQYWNVADTFNGGTIFYQSDDGSTSLTNPVNQNVALVNGQSAASIALNTAGNVTLTVRDTGDPTIVPQSVLVPVSGTFFDIIAPAQTNTGAPFNMIITLKDTTGNTVPAFGPVTLQAVRTDGSDAQGILDVTSVNLANGVASINNQRYTIAEDIRIKVQGHGTISTSNVIRFVPRAIYYLYKTIPTEADVNIPFNVVLQAMDQDTGTEVINFNRSNLPLQAYSVVTNLPVTGNFIPTSVNVVNGVINLQAVYNRAETIFLVLTDNTSTFDPPPLPTQAQYNSQSSIKVRPGAVSSVSGNDFDMQSNETVTMSFVARDIFNNPIPDQTLSFTVEPFDPGKQMNLNTLANSFTAKTDANGSITVTFAPFTDCNGVVTVVIRDMDRPQNGFTKLLNITVNGLGRGPLRALGMGENRIPVNTRLPLDINFQPQAGGTLRTFYRLDNGAWQPYDDSIGVVGFSETRQYTLEWYSEVCYDVACSNPVSELSVSGAPNMIVVVTYVLSDSISGYPSPFNPKGPNGDNFLTIQYPLATAQSVEIDIYDLFGQKVWHRDIDAGQEGGLAKPDNRVLWTGVNDDGTTVANGGYVVTVKTGSSQVMKTKVLVVK